VQHARNVGERGWQILREYEIQRQVQSGQIAFSNNGTRNPRTRFQCPESGYVSVRDLWKASLAGDTIDKAVQSATRIGSSKNVENATRKDNNPTYLSVGSQELWNPETQLAHRGSFLNVYLDWYVYVGPWALALFLLFIFSLIGTFGWFLWTNRTSEHSRFYLATSLQLVAIALVMYAQPYLFIKYFWVVFGIAAGMMIHSRVIERR
jgi:hypothetical protein